MDAINPDYYKRNGLEAIDVAEAFFYDKPHLWDAWIYLSRMGEKEGNSLEQEAGKIKWYLDRHVWYMNRAKREEKSSAAIASAEEQLRRNRELNEKFRGAFGKTDAEMQQMKEDTEW